MKIKNNDRTLNCVEYMQHSIQRSAQDHLRETENLFTYKDHVLVRKAITTVLNDEEQEVILLNFWENYSFDQISTLLEVSYEKVLLLFENAQKKIKNFCLSQESFSRSIAPSNRYAA